jgi:hypothetical protein
MVTKLIDIDAVEIDQVNPMDHDEANIDAIKASLERFGSGRSIVVDAHDIVRAGNGTVEAARAAGIKKVMVVEPDPDTLVAVKRADWNDQEAKGYSVADNRAAQLAKFNVANLQGLIESIPDVPLDALGFKQDEIDSILGRFDAQEAPMPGLDGGEGEHTQMRFVLTAEQAMIVGRALESAVERNDAEPGKKGAALTAACEYYLEG